ncbi:MAG: T9SS type A sorting domain-containing protein [Aureispira sp.]|nr:T9SS type A sorting domain-containing protein [Aureispira sp.]
MDGLTSSNFSLTENGNVSGATITNVVQNTDTTWTITADRGTGDGFLTLNLENVDNASANSCPLPMAGSTYTIPNPTSIETINVKEPNILVYPNPVSDKLIVQFQNIKESTNMQLSNAIGQTIYQQEIDDNSSNPKIELDMTNLNVGLYFLTLQLKSGTKLNKQIIKY